MDSRPETEALARTVNILIKTVIVIILLFIILANAGSFIEFMSFLSNPLP